MALVEYVKVTPTILIVSDWGWNGSREVFKQPVHADSDRAKSVTKALEVFKAKRVQHYALLEDVEYQHMFKVFESHFNIPSHQHINNTVIHFMNRHNLLVDWHN